MTEPAIRVEGLSKYYHIGQVRSRRRSFRDALADGVSAPFRRLGRLWRSGAGQDDSRSSAGIWALKDVSFEVKPGEVLGIIGRNGSGKSTLLKVLSRTTDPTEGKVWLRGRVGSLLEVGTGFHPELTGRENVFLNGAILGMRRAEMTRKFDEIAAFAEIEKFIDTPVKRYSSGMYVRLAFAVAAHLDSEILLMDEVLAVGDAGFQQKCLGKMQDVAQQGRTVLFVSHNMATIEVLCTRAIVLANGRIIKDSGPAEAVETYLASVPSLVRNSGDLAAGAGESAGRKPHFTSAGICAADGTPTESIAMGDDFGVRVSFHSDRPLVSPAFGFRVNDAHGRTVFILESAQAHKGPLARSVRSGEVTCYARNPRLNAGAYSLTIVLADSYEDVDRIENVLRFSVQARDVFGTGRVADVSQGPVYVMSEWQFSAKEPE